MVLVLKDVEVDCEVEVEDVLVDNDVELVDVLLLVLVLLVLTDVEVL